MIGEFVVWALWAFFVALTLVLYLRVDWHDWGLLGMTVVCLGITILLSMIVARQYGWIWLRAETRVLWQSLVLIGAPVAIAGYLAGMIREPIPRRQIAVRLLALAAALIVIYVTLDLIVGVPTP